MSLIPLIPDILTQSVQENTIVTRTVITSTGSYQQTIEDGFYCFCYSNSQGYSGLVSYWNNFALQSTTGSYSKYTATVPDYYPACTSATDYAVTIVLNNVHDYPINISYPYSTWNPYVAFEETSYSGTVDTTAFTLTCCTTGVLPLCS